MSTAANEVPPSDILDNSSSLVDLLENNSVTIDNQNYEPEIFQHSPYYMTQSMCNVLKTKSQSFTMLSLNCQSLQAKFDALKCYVTDINDKINYNISAICLQETWLCDQSDLSLLKLQGYNLISKGRSCSTHGGVAIYLHESYQYKVLTCNDSHLWDGQLIEINLKSDLVAPVNDRQKLVVANVYRPPRQNVDEIATFVNEINQLCFNTQRFNHVVVTGDFNIDLLKHQQNANINDFLDSMIANAFIPKITMPTRLTHRKGTLIYNFFVKISDTYSTTTSGIILCEISDHLPYFIALDYLTANKSDTRRIKVLNTHDSTIDNFRNDLNTLEVSAKLNETHETDVNSTYNNFSGTLGSLVNKHFPIKYVRFNKYKHKRNDWITSGILKSIAFRDKLYKRLKSTSETSSLHRTLKANLKLYNRMLKQTIRTAKKLFFEKCFDSFKNDIKNTWKTISNIINKTKVKHEFPKYFLINDSFECNQSKIAHEFNKYFVEIGPKLAASISPPSDKSFKDFLANPVTENFEFKTVDESQIIKTIDSLKSKSSQGIDKVSSKLLKSVKAELARPLKNIFNQSVQSGVFPDLLKIAKVVPVFKKQDNFKLENYRPISILPSVSKVFEKIMHSQIYEHFTNLRLFYISQYGFREKHSTDLAVLELVERLIDAMDQNHIPINIFLDLSKAFDTLDHKILLYKLRHYGFRNNAHSLLNSYLTNRFQYVDFGGEISQQMPLTVGVPQGSILGPLLFIIYINDLVNATSSFRPIIYADDTTLVATLNSFQNNRDMEINRELSKINDWLKLNKLSLNYSKTKAMVFHTMQRTVNYPDLYFENHKIEFVESFNLLGIILDKHLKWNSHTESISKKLAKTCGIIGKLKHTIPKSALRHIYNSLVLSYINYGLFIWGHRGKKIIKLQKKVVRNLTRSNYNAHTSGLFKSLKLLKYSDLCVLHDLKFCYRAENGLLPEYFLTLVQDLKNSNRLNRVTRQQFQLRIPRIRHEFARQGIKYRYPKIMNNIDRNIKDKISTHSYDGFKLYFKRATINEYIDVCLIENCYICGRT
jgi:hypothetical protein